MRRSLLLFSVVITSFAVFSSCNKYDISQDPSSIEGTWAVTSINSNQAFDWDGDGRTETDIYGTYNSCQRDIQLYFQYNGYGQIRQSCNSGWQNITWTLSNNNRNLFISIPNGDLDLSLTQFDNYTIRGEDQVTVNGRNFVITYTFQRVY